MRVVLLCYYCLLTSHGAFSVEPHVLRRPHHASEVSAHSPNAITTCFRVLVVIDFVQFSTCFHTPYGVLDCFPSLLRPHKADPVPCMSTICVEAR